MVRSRAVSAPEPGQDREVAALRDTACAPRGSRIGVQDWRARPGLLLDDGGTVRLSGSDRVDDLLPQLAVLVGRDEALLEQLVELAQALARVLGGPSAGCLERRRRRGDALRRWRARAGHLVDVVPGGLEGAQDLVAQLRVAARVDHLRRLVERHVA